MPVLAVDVAPADPANQRAVCVPRDNGSEGGRKRQIGEVLEGNQQLFEVLSELVQIQRDLLNLKKLKYGLD